MTAYNYNIIIYDIIQLLLLLLLVWIPVLYIHFYTQMTLIGQILNFFTNLCFLMRYWIIWTLMKWRLREKHLLVWCKRWLIFLIHKHHQDVTLSHHWQFSPKMNQIKQHITSVSLVRVSLYPSSGSRGRHSPSYLLWLSTSSETQHSREHIRVVGFQRFGLLDLKCSTCVETSLQTRRWYMDIQPYQVHESWGVT